MKYGEWIKDFTGLIKCSLCDNDAMMDTCSAKQNKSPFCPWCGAKMDCERSVT